MTHEEFAEYAVFSNGPGVIGFAGHDSFTHWVVVPDAELALRRIRENLVSLLKGNERGALEGVRDQIEREHQMLST